MKKRIFMLKLFYFYIGILILSLGIAMIIQANLGVSAWDVLHVGLYYNYGLTIGTWSQIVGLISVAITFILDRRLVSIGTILNMLFVGWFIDLFLFILPTIDNMFLQFIILIIGTIISGFGAGLYITAKLGPGPRDGLVIVISNKMNWGLGKVKTAVELLALLVGYLLGGPVFIGTLIVTLLIGPIMQFMIKWWDKRLEPVFTPREQARLS